MTTNEACEKFGLEKKELYKRIKAGMIPGVVKKGRITRRRLFPQSKKYGLFCFKF